MTRYFSATHSEVWLIELATGERRRVLPAAGSVEAQQPPARAAHFAGGWTADGHGLYVVSDRASEFRELMQLDLASGRLTRLSAHIPWDMNEGDLGPSQSGAPLAMVANVDGREELRLFDRASGRERTLPALPGGSVPTVRFHRAIGELAFVTHIAQGPGQIHSPEFEYRAPRTQDACPHAAGPGSHASPRTADRALEEFRRPHDQRRIEPDAGALLRPPPGADVDAWWARGAGQAGLERPPELPAARTRHRALRAQQADNEGHGFARRENADFAPATLVRFLEETVLR